MVSVFEKAFSFNELNLQRPLQRDVIKACLEQRLKSPGLDQPRNYIWGLNIDSVIARSRIQLPGFRAITTPKMGDWVCLRFDAAPRFGSRLSKRGRGPMFSVRPPIDWAREKLPNCGVEIVELNAFACLANIERIVQKNPNVKGNIIAAGFSVIGTISNVERFVKEFVDGIEGSGMRCWGYGTIMIDEV